MLEKLGTDRYSVEEIQAWMDANNLEIKQKHVHRPHQMERYPICELNIKGRVLYEGVPHSYVDNDANGYEIITDMGNKEMGYFFTIWTSHCVPIPTNSKEGGLCED